MTTTTSYIHTLYNNDNDKYYDTIWELNNSNSIVDIFINKRNYRILHTSFHSFKNYIIEYCNIRKDLLLCFDHYYLMKRFHGNNTTTTIITITTITIATMSVTIVTTNTNVITIGWRKAIKISKSLKRCIKRYWKIKKKKLFMWWKYSSRWRTLR